MENIFSGTVMALPERDEDLFERINKKTADRRRIAEEEAAKRPVVFPHSAMPADEFELRKAKLLRVSSAGARVAVGLVFIGAMVRDLITPGFALLVAGTCVIWAVHTYRRGGQYV